MSRFYLYYPLTSLCFPSVPNPFVSLFYNYLNDFTNLIYSSSFTLYLKFAGYRSHTLCTVYMDHTNSKHRQQI